jgi:hypothetical protein
MACKKVLVLCGDTYADRLWCIWYAIVLPNDRVSYFFVDAVLFGRELYTLFAMAEYWEDALNRVDIIDLATNGSIASKLEQFNLDDARCYNPNDLHKIRAAINAGPGGEERFTLLVRRIGRDLVERERNTTASSKGSWRSFGMSPRA